MAKTAEVSTIRPVIISLCGPKTTHTPALRFRTLLNKEAPEVELALA